jgi:hypothetical protein
VGTGDGGLIVEDDEDGEVVERDVHCAVCGTGEAHMAVYHFPNVPLLAVCEECDKKES